MTGRFQNSHSRRVPACGNLGKRVIRQRNIAARPIFLQRAVDVASLPSDELIVRVEYLDFQRLDACVFHGYLASVGVAS